MDSVVQLACRVCGAKTRLNGPDPRITTLRNLLPAEGLMPSGSSDSRDASLSGLSDLSTRSTRPVHDVVLVLLDLRERFVIDLAEPHRLGTTSWNG